MTSQKGQKEIICSHCKRNIKEPLDWDTVCVGDVLIGYATEKEVTVSAIGKDRFLYINYFGKEQAATKDSPSAKWRRRND